MKSVKPGRGPSFMGGIGSVAAIGFGIIWTIAAASMGAPFFFPLFGLVFIALGIFQAVYHFKNATGKNRFSAFDITQGDEESDPLNDYFGGKNQSRENAGAHPSEKGGFCPYCGNKAEEDHAFCKRCGKKIT